ncbi:sigma-70 family RNA polymerase sigma factor [Candidatus Dojkabacteria bacterium]|nr:sigma-70 family RNA polymerase sigma factor [Candidatus Dojkabacteria bacterium]
MDDLSEKEQIALIKKTKLDKKCFGKIYEYYYQKVLDFAKKRVTDIHTAEDLTGDIFEKIFRSFGNFQWQGISLSAWIFRIARNAVIDFYRKNNKRKGNISMEDMQDKLIAPDSAIETGILEDEIQVMLYNSIREFGDEEQYLIYFKFFAEMSNKEIAEESGMTETNVGTKLHRIRKKLKRIMEKAEKTGQ